MTPLHVIVMLAIIMATIVFFIITRFFGLWVRAFTAGFPIPFKDLIGMNLRRVPMGMIVDAYIMAKMAGLDVRTEFLEVHYLAGGNVPAVVKALIRARQQGIDVSPALVAGADLEGHDVETADLQEIAKAMRGKEG